LTLPALQASAYDIGVVLIFKDLGEPANYISVFTLIVTDRKGSMIEIENAKPPFTLLFNSDSPAVCTSYNGTLGKYIKLN